MARNRVIGKANKMPWHLSADLKKFKKLTMGHPIIMGRKTHESIGKALPGRCNIIISRNVEYQQPGCQVYGNIDAAISSCLEHDEIFIIGGSALYEKVLPKADCIYLTLINKTFEGDAYFPEWDQSNWYEKTRQDIFDDATVPYSYSFVTMARVSRTVVE